MAAVSARSAAAIRSKAALPAACDSSPPNPSTLADGADTPNARDVRDRAFMLYLNENYGEQEAKDITAAIIKAERYFGR